MLINGEQYRTIWLGEDKKTVEIIDQRYLPHKFIIEKIKTVKEMAAAIKDMHLRGAPLIGAAAGYGVYLSLLEAGSNSDLHKQLDESIKLLESTRPTAVNLKWALDRMKKELINIDNLEQMTVKALEISELIADEDSDICKNIGIHGVKLIEEISKKKNGAPVQILTHCNAGALATVDHGTATSPMYEAAGNSIPIHVWVDETRPRNQGKLTSWELTQNNIPNTIICDNTGGHIMQHGMVDIVIVGTDRTTANGDAANKIGTYLKALAAADNGVPFYVALPSSTIDWSLLSGKDIPIEERSESEVLYIDGLKDNDIETVKLFGDNSKALNFGFDVTPARLITGFITDKGICTPSKLRDLFGVYMV